MTNLNQSNFQQLLNLEEFTLLDIGASGGVEKKWKKFESIIKIVGYEPDKMEYENLIQENISSKNIFINAALGEENIQSNLYITKKQQLSSLFKPDPIVVNKYVDPGRFDITDEITVNLTTVDESLELANITSIDFLKVDTQGSELNILKGSINTLRNIAGIEIEVEFNPIYQNQPIFSEIDTFIRGFGFELMDFEPAYYLRKENDKNYPSAGQIMFANAIYFPNDLYLQNRIDAKFLKKIIFISIIYKKYDYTMYLLTTFSELLTDETVNNIYQYLDSMKSPSTYLRRFINILKSITKNA